MLALLNLSDGPLAWLREQRAVYAVEGGRINVAGLTPSNPDCVCEALTEAWACSGDAGDSQS